MSDPFDIDPAEVRRVAAKLNALGREPSRTVQVEVRRRRGPAVARCKQLAHVEVQPLTCPGDDPIWVVALVDGPHRSAIGEFDSGRALSRELDRWKRQGYSVEWKQAKGVLD